MSQQRKQKTRSQATPVRNALRPDSVLQNAVKDGLGTLKNADRDYIAPNQISTVISKRIAGRAQLREHLREGARITRWLWVASGSTDFANIGNVRQRLDQEGMEFVGRTVHAKQPPKKRES